MGLIIGCRYNPYEGLLHCERPGGPLIDVAPLAPLAPLAFPEELIDVAPLAPLAHLVARKS